MKCDIKKFFDSINHNILLNILQQYIPDKDIVWLLEEVIESYSNSDNNPSLRATERSEAIQSPIDTGLLRRSFLAPRNDRCGLPLGNLTSQLFANVYMNVFDQFVKHKLKAKYYIRYADDFVFLHNDRYWLEEQIPKIKDFLQNELSLTLHPNKLFLITMSSGIDFLGWKFFTNHRILRKVTQKRILKKLRENPTDETLQSYLGLLKRGNGLKLRGEMLNEYWLWS